MSQIDAVIAELRQLPEPKIQQVADFVHSLHSRNPGDSTGLQATAGCMTPDEADQFQQVIDEYCERIDPGSLERLD